MKAAPAALLLLSLVIAPLAAQSPLPPGPSVEVGFSPGETALAVVEEAIDAAHSEILTACYEFTSREIATALETAIKRGVSVQIVADGKDVETGSFNYTNAAVQHNAENALVLWNVPEVAKKYAAEWQRMWEESQEPFVPAAPRPVLGHAGNGLPARHGAGYT